jgi:hypothetical protein
MEKMKIKTILKKIVPLIVGLLAIILMIPLDAYAEESNTPIGPYETFHLPPEKPTEVEIGLYLIEITDISAASTAFPTFSVEMFMDLKWKDPRVEFIPTEDGAEYDVYVEHAAEEMLDKIWWPDIEIENEKGKRNTEALELIVYADGTIEYIERFNVTVEANFDLMKFPFDEQDLELDVESFEWPENDVVFVPNASKIGYDEKMPLMEWEITGVSNEVRSEQEIRADDPFSEFIFKAHVRRLPGFYLWKILLPFIIIVNLSWSVFWMTGEGSSGRMARTYVALLTVVAFHRVLAGYLPRIPAITFTDAMVLISYASIIATVVENLIVHTLQQKNQIEEAAKIDKIARWVIPVTFIVLNSFIVLTYLT